MNRVAIVTGSTRGIGRAYALRLARDGYRIAVADINLPQAENVREMMKAVAPALRDQRSGSIINISSNTFLSGVPGFAHYVSSKGAIVGLTRSAARELGEYNVRVNCILPGLTRTEVVRTSDEPGRYDQLIKSQSIKRVEVPDDLVGTAAFLASDDSAFMTGQALTVDGGNSFH